MYIKITSLSLSLYENGINFLKSLGYCSERTQGEQNLSFEDFKDFTQSPDIKQDKIFSDQWVKAELLFQLTEEDLTQQQSLFNTEFTFSSANDIYKSYMFFALELKGNNYSRTQLASITREMNKPFAMPVFILFKYGNKLTLSVIDRRLNKKDDTCDVLEKITMIKDVRIDNPHHAHIDIFYDLSREQLQNKFHFSDFEGLHKAWKETLNIKELNNRFYKELSNWYFWAMQKAVFPGATSEQDKQSLFQDKEKQKEFNAQCLIRLICRLLFVWFIKEKHLVREKFFSEVEIKKLIKTNTNESSAYYKAILQNLFFAVLNQEHSKRAFRTDGVYGYGNEFHYKHLIKNPDAFIKEFEDVPFMNGGLFECLDEVRKEKINNSNKEVTRKYYFDGFSDKPEINKILYVPDELFFAGKKIVDLSAEFDNSAKYKNIEVRGLINIFNSYKFTVEENTPIEEDVALDPELLGRVFENLLASFNPETKTTARKATGSYYTPREIVDYMVNESIKASLESTLVNQFGIEEEIAKEKLNILINYNETPNPFNNEQTRTLIEAIDKLKILDPACGSGAFPMGMLHKLVYILEKLDFDNKIWKETQSKKLSEEMKKTLDISYTKEEREQLQKDINEIFDSSMYDPNYARKMYIIENCIYGVDIQPVATQISKLRFFISLITEQKTDPSKPNCGVRPLPNLETKFIAANTLIDIINSGFLKNQKIVDLERELKEIRHKIFSVKTVKAKLNCREKDCIKRKELAEELHCLGLGAKESQALASWDPYDKKTSSPWFNPEWMFGIKDGFDIVIGNPPYIKERDSQKVFNVLINSDFGRKYHQGKMDYWYYFLHKAIDLSNKKGIIAFITPRYWLNSAGATSLIKRIKQELSFINIVDIGKLKVFDSVVGLHMIALYSKYKKDTIVYKKLSKSLNDINSKINSENIVISSLHNNSIISDNYEVILESRLNYSECISLGEISDISQGVVEASDCISNKMYSKYPRKDVFVGKGIFVLTKDEVNELNLTKEEKACLVPYADGNNLFRYKIIPSNKYLIYSDQNIKLKIEKDNKYLRLKKHLDNLAQYITSSNKPYGIHRPRKRYYFDKSKIIMPSMFANNDFVIDYNMKLFVGMSYNVILVDNQNYLLEYILAILNSKIALDWFYSYGKKRGAGVDIGVQKLRCFPIKKCNMQKQKEIAKKVKLLMSDYDSNKFLDDEINNEISEIYKK